MSVTKDDDKIWLNSERKLDGICAEIRTLLAAGRDVLLLAHFEDFLRQVKAALLARSISFRPIADFDRSLFETEKTTQTVWVGLAQSFHPRRPIVRQNVSPPDLSIIVVEHYPLAARDQAIIDAAQSLPGDTRVCFHAALTDALLVHFGGDRVQRLFKQIGADEKESLSNRLIDAAIRAAQEKIAQQVLTEMPTLSAEDWFKYNLRVPR